MDYRKLIVESGLRMANSGLTVETWGNISARDPETGLVYLTPSAMQYDTITVDDVVVAELDGKIVQGTRKPTIETGMHLAVYRARKDVNAVIHTHPTYSMVYSCQGKDIPLFMDEAAQIMGDTCHTPCRAVRSWQTLSWQLSARKRIPAWSAPTALSQWAAIWTAHSAPARSWRSLRVFFT